MVVGSVVVGAAVVVGGGLETHFVPDDAYRHWFSA